MEHIQHFLVLFLSGGFKPLTSQTVSPWTHLFTHRSHRSHLQASGRDVNTRCVDEQRRSGGGQRWSADHPDGTCSPVENPSPRWSGQMVDVSGMDGGPVGSRPGCFTCSAGPCVCVCVCLLPVLDSESYMSTAVPLKALGLIGCSTACVCVRARPRACARARPARRPVVRARSVLSVFEPNPRS